MIKLNNKKITYVALADSNNSVKGVKEIWYADSANSVKLVYRRKDALIEGEDYEKYHFVKGDGSAYIRTNHTLNENLDWEVKVANFTDYKCLFWQREGEVTDNLNTVLVKAVNYYPGFRVGNKSSEVRINPFTDTEITVSTSNDTIVINGQTYQVTKGTSTISGNFALFYTAFHLDSTTQDVCCAYFRFLDSNRNYIQNLVPCKLLKPVPKWLDANGIRRQVGECGMIDLVSGKFYGNVNSTGTFTVENYYERKEWLVAEIYETTGVNPMCDLPINSDTFEFRVIMQSENPINVGHIKNPNYWYFSDTLTNIKVWNTTGRTTDFTSNIGSNDMTFKSTSSEFAINNIQVTKYGFPAKYKTFFNNRPNGNAIVYNSPITVDNKERYIPCTLTMDLPASMDANNIARTKGTSGMWDLVSDRFYGNVANSGTFKAVNLAEGVDYEVHQWLVTENSDGAFMMALPLNTYNFSLKRRILELSGNCYHFLEGGITLQYFTSTHVLSVNDNGVSTFTSVAQVSFGDDIEIKSTDDSLTFNGEVVPIPDSYFTYLRFKKSVYGTIMKISTSSITVDGIERYIPVKLLKSIPAKYDANGIARNAGECGMYDTVNDVFYGNVASSGTFTVSDDS